MFVNALPILNVAWKFDMISTLRPLHPPPPPPTALCHSCLFRFSSLPEVSSASRNPDNIYAHIIHGISSMLSKSKTKFGMERVCIHEPTMLYSIILDNLWDAENAD